jgi:hypothetical protein
MPFCRAQLETYQAFNYIAAAPNYLSHTRLMIYHQEGSSWEAQMVRNLLGELLSMSFG